MTSTAQAPGITRADLQRHDLSVPGREVIQNRVEIGPDAPAFRHKHKNVGSGNAAELATYVVEKGKPFLVLVD